jgi:hypothetical protein
MEMMMPISIQKGAECFPLIKSCSVVLIAFLFLIFTACGSPASSEDNAGPNNSDPSPPAEDSKPSGDQDSQIPPQNDAGPSASLVCKPSPQGSAGPVLAPVLQQTLPGSWDENWLASPAVVDIDGDGLTEIVACRHSVLYVYRGDGSLLWQTAFGYSASTSPEHGSTRMWASPVVADFDGDQDMEIAVGGDADSSANANICLYDHRGELLPGWPQRFGDTEVRSLAAADVDADGVMEILVNKTGPGPATAVFELDGRMHTNWPQVSNSCDPPSPAEPCWDFGGYNQNIGAADMDGDGVMDVVSSYDAIGFGIFSGDGQPFLTAPGFSDAVVTSVEAYHDMALSQQGWGNGDRSEFTYSPPVMADLNQDGNLEVVLAGDHEHTQSTENRGVTLWALNADLTRPSGWQRPKDMGPPLGGAGDLGQNIVHTMPSPSVADLDGRQGLEIVVPGYDGILYAYHSDGSVYWQYRFSPAATPYIGAGEAVIADLNQDGSPEIVFTTFSSGAPGNPDAPAHLIILSADGALLHQVELHGRGSMAAPTIADCDNDGGLEIIISLKDTLGGGQGGVQIWDVPNSAANCVLWGTGRGNFQRQGHAF